MTPADKRRAVEIALHWRAPVWVTCDDIGAACWSSERMARSNNGPIVAVCYPVLSLEAE